MNDNEKPLPSGIQLTAFDPVYRNTPEIYLDHLRVEAPIHHDVEANRFILTRADDVAAVLKNRRMNKDPDKSVPDSYMRRIVNDAPREKSMLFLDDPDHHRLRSLVTQAFTARSITEIRPHIAEVANQLLDEIGDREEFDVIADFASPLPIIIIAEMLGVDPADRADFLRWSRVADISFSPVLTPEQRSALEEGFGQLGAYFETVIAERRAHPGTDLISAMVAAADGEDRLSDQEIKVMARLLLVAGNVTTTDLIGNAVRLLIDHPEQRERLAAEPGLINNMVEEVLRRDPPVNFVARIPPEKMSLHGVEIDEGQTLFVSLNGAALDPELNEDPLRFDVARQNPVHYAFGGGAHFCLGAQLARAEAQIAIPLLFKRFPDLTLAKEPERKIAPGFNGYSELLVRKSLT